MVDNRSASKPPRVAPFPYQWERFCRAIIEGRSQARAAVIAGYSERGASQQGVLLMRYPRVIARLAELREEAAHRLDISTDKVLHEYARIAFGDIARVIQWTTNRATQETEITITPSSRLTADDRAMIQSIEHEVREVGGGVKIKTTRVKFYDRTKALDALARHLALFNDKFSIEVLTTAITEHITKTGEFEGWAVEEIRETIAAGVELITAGFGPKGAK